MNPNEHEDSSGYTNEPRETTFVRSNQPAVAPAPQPKPSKKKSKAPLVLSFLLLLAIAAAAVFGWLWYQQNGRVNDLQSDLSVARNDVSRLESAAKANATLDMATAEEETITETSNSDSDMIIEKSLAHQKAKKATGSTSLEAKFDKKAGEFARATVSAPSEGPGAVVVYLKEVNDEWIVIGDSTSEFSTLKTEFGITDDFLTP